MIHPHRALVLSGGGTLAAFEAGVIAALAQLGVRWDRFVGTSAGALNAAYMAAVPPVAQATRSEALARLWRGFTREDFYTSNLSGLVGEVIGKPFPYRPSIFDTAPMGRTIHKHISAKPSKDVELTVVTASLRTGTARAVRSTDVEDMRPWVRASASVPVLFPPMAIDGDHWVDGGVVRNDPIADAVLDGVTDIDVVLSTPMTPRARGKREIPTLASIAEDAITDIRATLSNGDPSEWRLALGAAAHAKVTVYAPTEDPNVSFLTFDPEVLSRLVRHGYKIGATTYAGAPASSKGA